MGNMKKTLGILKIASLAYLSLIGGEGIKLTVDASAINTKIGDERLYAAQARFSKTFVEAVNGRKEIQIRRNSDGMKLLSFIPPKSMSDLYDGVESQEQYSFKNPIVEQQLVLMDGKAYRAIFDEKTNSYTEFEPLENEARNLFNKINGIDEIIDLFNVLTDGELTVIQSEKKEDGIKYKLLDERTMTFKTGSGQDILSEALKEVKMKSKYIIDSEKRVEKEEFGEEDVLLGDGSTLKHTIIDKKALEGCIKVGNKYVVEDAELVSKSILNKEQCLGLVFDKIEQIEGQDKEVVQAMILDMYADSVSKEDVAMFYDYLIQSEGNKAYRDKYIARMDKQTHRKVYQTLMEYGITEKEVQDMTINEVMNKLNEIAGTREFYLDENDELSNRAKDKESKLIIEMYDLAKKVALDEVYKRTALTQDSFEEKVAMEEKARKEQAKAEEKALRKFGFKEQVQVSKAYSQSKQADGQESFVFNEDDGSLTLVTEVVREKRSYTKQTASTISQEDFMNGEVSDVVSSEDMDGVNGDFVQASMFDMYNMDTGMEVEADEEDVLD